MKNLLLSLLSIIIFMPAFGQINAITDTGEKVLLYESGVWEYANDSLAKEKKIPFNPGKFKKDNDADFLLKSKILNLGVWVDTKKWKFMPAENNKDAEYEFELKDGDLYGMMITERVEIPIESLGFIALENSKSLAPDTRIISQEYRNVNGLNILHLHMNGTMMGIKFSYYGYYYSNSSGSVQFVFYTSENLLDSYIPEIEKILNGMTEI